MATRTKTMRATIAKLEPETNKWALAAHGARWDWAEAEDMAERLRERGCKVVLLPVEMEE